MGRKGQAILQIPRLGQLVLSNRQVAAQILPLRPAGVTGHKTPPAPYVFLHRVFPNDLSRSWSFHWRNGLIAGRPLRQSRVARASAESSYLEPVMHFPRSGDAKYAEGVSSFSPGLRGTSYPGFAFQEYSTLKGLQQSFGHCGEEHHRL